jgi:hypothetical protein
LPLAFFNEKVEIMAPGIGISLDVGSAEINPPTAFPVIGILPDPQPPPEQVPFIVMPVAMNWLIVPLELVAEKAPNPPVFNKGLAPEIESVIAPELKSTNACAPVIIPS